MNADTTEAVRQIAANSRVASRSLATASAAIKDRALSAMADALESQASRIIVANESDRARGVENGISEGLQDRLKLDTARIKGIADALRQLAALPDPIGDVVRGSTLENGLKLRQLRVPMGVVGMIYEARPNVTVDAAGIALKSGNAVILRGGSAALDSNIVLVDVLRGALEDSGLPADLIQTIDPLGREGAVALMQARGLVDVLVPRGGAGLIQTVVREAQVPVIETGVGNCHVYVDSQVDQDQALAIVINSKTHRDSVCNAAETLLVHEDVAKEFVPRVLEALAERGVTIHGDSRVAELAPGDVSVVPATDEDWAKEYLGPEMAVGVVDSLESAINHIQTWSSGHTDAICTTSISAANEFTGRVDSAVVNVNASTRFTDGGEFGLGAEIGISTQKLHARGPMGLSELTTTKWVVMGDGQIR
ncbi:MAG: glutamate-5-semialdehyde dehydrogenase [Scrofimicrobium sp.]